MPYAKEKPPRVPVVCTCTLTCPATSASGSNSDTRLRSPQPSFSQYSWREPCGTRSVHLLTFSNVLAFAIFSTFHNRYLAYIHRESTKPKLIVYGILHQMRKLHLAEVQTRIAES